MKIINVKLRYTGYKKVKAHLVGGSTGVFAVWRETIIEDNNRKETIIEDNNKRIEIHLAAGDDGYWWEIGCYDIFWISHIIEALEKVSHGK